MSFSLSFPAAKSATEGKLFCVWTNNDAVRETAMKWKTNPGAGEEAKSTGSIFTSQVENLTGADPVNGTSRAINKRWK